MARKKTNPKVRTNTNPDQDKALETKSKDQIRTPKPSRIDEIFNLRESRIERDLSILFSKGQIQIIDKLLAKEPLTKTENEVYSRTINKKFDAILGLNSMALVLKR